MSSSISFLHLAAALYCCVILVGEVRAEEKGQEKGADLPVVYSDNFESGAAHWQPT